MLLIFFMKASIDSYVKGSNLTDSRMRPEIHENIESGLCLLFEKLILVEFNPVTFYHYCVKYLSLEVDLLLLFPY